MSVLLLGKNGQVGWELQRALLPHTALDRSQLDVSDLTALRDAIRQHRPSVLVNATAYTAVDRAEREAELAYRINAEAVAVMAQEMEILGGALVHYSTDYVFNGRGERFFNEDDPAAPLNIYGRSKWKGEQAVRASGVHHLILRTSWCYGEHGHNFAKTMLKLAREKETLRVVDDQWGAPTHAALVADVTAEMLAKLRMDNGGTYHVVAGGVTNWHCFAQFLIDGAEALGMKVACAGENIQPISSEAYPAEAQRPSNSRLSTEKLQRVFDIRLPDWQHHAELFIRDYTQRSAT